MGSNSSQDAALIFVIGLVVAVVVLLIVREILCWYWKINQLIALLTEIRDGLRIGPPSTAMVKPAGMALSETDGPPERTDLRSSQIGRRNVRSDRSPNKSPASESDAEPIDFCYHCGAKVPENARKCPDCGKEI